MKNFLKWPEKDAQRDPDEKGWACYCCRKEGYLMWDCLQASKTPPAPCPVCKRPQWKKDFPRRQRSPGLDSEDKTEGAQGSTHKLPS